MLTFKYIDDLMEETNGKESGIVSNPGIPCIVHYDVNREEESSCLAVVLAFYAFGNDIAQLECHRDVNQIKEQLAPI